MEKKIIYLVFSLIVCGETIAQSNNPFEEIGREARTLTLTKGVHIESFDEDSIQRIGSALVNVRSMKMIKLVLTPAEQRIIDNSKVSRFLSVDPLNGKFPELTPYQYASNRPIDGIDLDGLEYLSYNLNIDVGKMTDKSPGAITSAGFTWYNANQHNAHGSLGQGVQYNIRYYDGNKFLGKDAFFIARNATRFGISIEYGNYMGATCLFKLATDGHGLTGEFDYDLPAVDQVDFLAYRHDKGYDALKAVGQNSLFNDWGTTPVDETALNGWNDFMNKYKTGATDPYSGQAVTGGERGAAWRAAFLFDNVINSKKADISYWMQSNFSKEAANHTNKGMYGKKDTDFNYNLFLQKYMTKDGEGNWKRKEGMWTQDEQTKDWTPNKPKS